MVLDITAILVAGISLLGSIFAVVYTTKKQGKHDKEMLIMKQKLESYETHEINYENCRYKAIVAYLQRAGKLLYSPITQEAAMEFGESIGEVFMYIPDEKTKDFAKGLNNLISDIISLGNSSTNEEKKKQLIEQASSIFFTLCDSFSTLGVKRPLPIEDQQ